MSSLNITVKIKAPRLCLIKTQKNQRTLLSVAKCGGPSDVGDHCLAGGPRPDLHAGGPQCKVHITSRTGLISTSDNNYQEEYTQNDFFVIFIPPQHKEREITALGERRESRKTLPGAGSSIKFAVPLTAAGEQLGGKPASLLYGVIIDLNTALTVR